MAHKKAAGSTHNGRDSNPKYRGVKTFGGQFVRGGSVLIRQCGNKFHAGKYVGVGRDYTLFALIDGYVRFKRMGTKYRRYVSIEPMVEQAESK